MDNTPKATASSSSSSFFLSLSPSLPLLPFLLPSLSPSYFNNFPITIKAYSSYKPAKTLRIALNLISFANNQTISQLHFKANLHFFIWTYSITHLPQSNMYLFPGLQSLSCEKHLTLSCEKHLTNGYFFLLAIRFFPYFQCVPAQVLSAPRVVVNCLWM